MHTKSRNLLFFAFFIIPYFLYAQSLEPLMGREMEIGIEERLDEYIPDDIYLIDTEGKRVKTL